MKRKQKGFTLVEIMVVVVIVGLLSALAVVSFMKARTDTHTNTCKNNLRLIDAAVDQYALVNSNALPASMNLLVGTNVYLKSTPFCSGGGTYTLPSVLGGKSSCNVHGTL